MCVGDLQERRGHRFDDHASRERPRFTRERRAHGPTETVLQEDGRSSLRAHCPVRRRFEHATEGGNRFDLIARCLTRCTCVQLYQVGNIPPGICDLWAAAGQPRDCEYTWDMQLNTNKNFSSATNVPRARFDRLYYRPSANVQLRTNTFELRGLEKIPSVDRFCSDHWALLVRLQNE